MKQYVDRKRSVRQFEVRDWVHLKLQSYRQTSLVVRKNFKLAARYYGPYQVLEKIGPAAYKLYLPSSATIHPIFHVSLLKKKVGEGSTIIQDLPSFEEDEVIIELEKVLKTRVIFRDGQQILQGLVQWSQLPAEDATWEDKSFILAQFPSFLSS